MSVSKTVSQPLVTAPQVEVSETKGCISKTITWVRTCEQGSTLAKVGIFFLKLMATLVLFASIVGIPLYLAFYKEYTEQNVEQKYQSLADDLKQRKIDIESSKAKNVETNDLLDLLALGNESALQAKEDHKRLQGHLSQVMKQKRDVASLAQKQEADLERQEQSLKKQAEDIEGLTTKGADLQKRLDGSSKDLDATKKLLAESEAAKKLVEEQLQKARTTLSEQRKVLDKQSDEIDEQRKAIDTSRDEVDVIKAKYAALKNENEQLRQENASFKDKTASVCAPLVRELKKTLSGSRLLGTAEDGKAQLDRPAPIDLSLTAEDGPEPTTTPHSKVLKLQQSLQQLEAFLAASEAANKKLRERRASPPPENIREREQKWLPKKTQPLKPLQPSANVPIAAPKMGALRAMRLQQMQAGGIGNGRKEKPKAEKPQILENLNAQNPDDILADLLSQPQSDAPSSPSSEDGDDSGTIVVKPKAPAKKAEEPKSGKKKD